MGRKPARHLILLIRQAAIELRQARLVPQELLVPRDQLREDEAMQRQNS